MLLNCGVGEDSWESLGLQGDPTSPSLRKSALNIHWKDWGWTETPILWPPDVKNWLTGKGPDAQKDRRQEKEMTEDEMLGWYYWLDGHEFEQAPGVGDGQGTLECCSLWGHKELDMTEQLTDLNWTGYHGLDKLSHRINHYKYICIFVTIQVNNQCIHWLPQKGEK